MYTNDYDDVYPYARGTKAVQYVTAPYTENPEIRKSYNPRGGNIRFNLGVSGANSSSIPEPAVTVLLFESEPWPDGRRAVAFCDGHAKFIGAQAWADMAKHLKPEGIKQSGKALPLNYGEDFGKDPNRDKKAAGSPSLPAPSPPDSATLHFPSAGLGSITSQLGEGVRIIFWLRLG